MTKEAASTASTAAERLDFSPSGVLSRIRGTLAGWVTTLTGIAAVIFGGVSLREFVKAPATVDPQLVATALLSLFFVALGGVLIIGASGWASSLRAAPQDGAFRSAERDPLRFFPRDRAPDLLQEYEDEVIRFRAARLRDDLPAMQEALYWADSHSRRLWDWLEAYRTREASHEFTRSSALMGLGVLLAIAGTLGFADALRLMKSPLPAGVIVQGPRSGYLTLRATVPELINCATLDSAGQLGVPVTVMNVVTPTADQQANGIDYVASVVPPLSNLDGCTVKVYEVTSQQGRVQVDPEISPPSAEAPDATDKAAGGTGAAAAE